MQSPSSQDEILASYSRRRHEVYVMNSEGDMIFSIQGDELRRVTKTTLHDDEKLKAWVLENYKSEIEDLLPAG